MKYRTIVADPPWEIGMKERPDRTIHPQGGTRPEHLRTMTMARRDLPYPTMPLHEIAQLHFSDGTVLSLHAVGHDPDGIGFDLK